MRLDKYESEFVRRTRKWFLLPAYNINFWLKWKNKIEHELWKSDILARYVSNNKKRHKRHIKNRDYGRLFRCAKFYYDPYQDGEEEEMDYFEERARLREIEGYKE